MNQPPLRIRFSFQRLWTIVLNTMTEIIRQIFFYILVVFRFSFQRLWTIALNTMTEIIRQKFFYILVVFAIVVLISSLFFKQFSSLEQIKFIKDFGLAAIAFFGAVIAIVGTAELLPMELENRTIYPILAKPVFRAEFLFGKFMGMIMLILLTVLLMSLIFGTLLFYTERSVVASATTEGGLGITPAEIVRQIQHQIRDPNLLWAIGLIYFKLVVVCSLGIFIGTYATSVIFNVICSTILYICGHLVSTARQEWMSNPSAAMKMILGILVFFVPDLSFFNVADAVVTGQFLSMTVVFEAIGYAIFYTLVVLLVAHFIFENKEI